jgi:hypothetical protein
MNFRVSCKKTNKKEIIKLLTDKGFTVLGEAIFEKDDPMSKRAHLTVIFDESIKK